jgi:hypothetical protein
MPIRQFLSGENFNPETTRILSVAFELTCIALRVGDCDDDVRQTIANKIITLAKAGERNPDVLCEQALKDIRGPHQSADHPLDKRRLMSMQLLPDCTNPLEH